MFDFRIMSMYYKNIDTFTADWIFAIHILC